MRFQADRNPVVHPERLERRIAGEHRRIGERQARFTERQNLTVQPGECAHEVAPAETVE
jgi:hypothetical protein